jgi:hypothetical protein
MMTFRSETPKSCGIVELDHRGVVHGFHEKIENPPGNLANAAVYIIEPEVVNSLTALTGKEVDFSTEVIPRFLGHIHTYRNVIYHRDIGSVESLLKAQLEFPGDSPAESDTSWRDICGDGSLAVASNLLRGLKKVLLLEDVAPEAKPVPYQSKICEVKKVASNESLVETYKGRSSEEPLFFLEYVQSGFSSKRLFEQYGIKSFSICSTSLA